MSENKYPGMDVHQSSRRGGTIAVVDENERLSSETIIDTRVDPIQECFRRLAGNVYVALADGTMAASRHAILVLLCGISRVMAYLDSLGRCSEQGQRRRTWLTLERRVKDYFECNGQCGCGYRSLISSVRCHLRCWKANWATLFRLLNIP